MQEKYFYLMAFHLYHSW